MTPAKIALIMVAAVIGALVAYSVARWLGVEDNAGMIGGAGGGVAGAVVTQLRSRRPGSCPPDARRA